MRQPSQVHVKRNVHSPVAGVADRTVLAKHVDKTLLGFLQSPVASYGSAA